ncbi:hypothetical protein [Brucella tritici]|uniref:Uncharacterized protein n=1 Tax=Brucella tritici TaxID=94626 RepID=A0A6L3Y8K9_9HYPH|nr:hypothetical protein [Brucella tritici]KAB2680026.1 hypothetical protein F9L08_21755 [Brucella tritici]
MARKSKRVDFLTVIVLMSMPAFLLTVLVMLSLTREKPPAAKSSLVELKSGSQTPDIKNFGDDGFGSSSSKRGQMPSSLALVRPREWEGATTLLLSVVPSHS